MPNCDTQRRGELCRRSRPRHRRIVASYFASWRFFARMCPRVCHRAPRCVRRAGYFQRARPGQRRRASPRCAPLFPARGRAPRAEYFSCAESVSPRGAFLSPALYGCPGAGAGYGPLPLRRHRGSTAGYANLLQLAQPVRRCPDIPPSPPMCSTDPCFRSRVRTTLNWSAGASEWRRARYLRAAFAT